MGSCGGIIDFRSVGKKASIAKITRPDSVGLILRKRLFDLLDRSRDSSIISIIGPPGSGKTSLIASYTDVQKIPCIWYKIDEGDSDIATFFHYMGMAVKKIAPKKGKPLPVFTPEYIHEASLFSRRYFEELFTRVETPFVIVFDNYQEVPYHSGFHEMIGRGLADIPGGINVFLLSRKALPLSFAQLYTGDRFCCIGWDEIRLTFEEAREFVRLKVTSSVSDETIHYFHEKTDGWAAGLVLMLQSYKENIDYRMLDKISSGKIFDYFAYEIFQKLERNTQELLLKTSFLPEMTARMAGQLADTRSAEEILDRLSRDRCFMDSCFQEKPVYHYHPLFGDFLRSVARDFFGEEDLSRIKKSAAEILEESGRIEDAVRLLRDCGDVDGLTRVIQNWAQSLVKQGRYQTLHDWLNSLPVDILLGNPWLRYWTGISRLPFSPDESMSQFETAFHQFRIRKEAEGVFLSWCGIVESIMYGSEGLEPLDRWLFSIEELMKEFNGFPSDDMEANVACSLIRCLALRRPVGFDMKKWADRIQVIIRKSTDIPLKVRALINLSSYFYSEGNFQKLEIVLESLKELLKNRDIPPLSRLTIDWVKAAYFNVMSRYDECRIVLTNGLELAHTLKMSLMEHLLLGHGVLSSLKSDDHETAKKDLQKMAAALSFLKPWEVCFYHYCAAWEALYRNDLAHASTHSEQCMKCEALGNPWPLTLAHLLNAYIAFAFGEIKKSKDHIIKARSIGIRSKNEFTSFVCLMTEAYFYIKQGKELAAIDAMREGLRIGREKGFVNLFMSQKDVLRTVFSKALDAGIESDYVISLIKRNNIVPDSACLEIEQWPWPLKIFTLGRFGLIKNGKPVQISGKVQHKPLEMLKALIAAGGREVAGDHLEDVLWPEAEGDAAHSAFATTLSRLRQLIGIEQAIKFQEGKASLDQRYCWVDVWPFERLIGKVDAAWNEIRTRSNGVPPIVRLAEKAVKMHTGPFLAGDNEPWAISTRERLRNKLLRNVMRLGLYWEEAGNREKAIECYQKGLEVDDLMEEFYRRIIKCYLQMGRRAEALAICTRCRTILSSVLGVEPSPETMALVRDLKR